MFKQIHHSVVYDNKEGKTSGYSYNFWTWQGILK